MRSVRFKLVLCLSLFNISVWGQQTPAPPPASQSSQAVSIINQALTVAGGTTVLGTINDYTATGNVTYLQPQNAQGTVTLGGKGLNQFRMDTSLPTGTRSHVVSNGIATTKAENGTISQLPLLVPVPGQALMPIPSSDAFPYERPMFPSLLASPYQQLSAALKDPTFRVLYIGTATLDGQPVFDVQVQRVLPGGQSDPMIEYNTRDFFVDTTSYQVVMTRDSIPKHVTREVLYSDFRPTNGVLIPFSISEQLGGQKVWNIQLTQINFNLGLTDSMFVLQ
jgi:hypothetical protein